MTFTQPLLALFVLPLMLLVALRERRLAGSRGRRAARLSLRLGLLALLGVALAGPGRERATVLPRREVLLLDLGLAEAPAQRAALEARLEAERARAQREGRSFAALLLPASEASSAPPPPVPAAGEARAWGGAATTAPGVGGALLGARALFQPGEGGRVLLLVGPRTDLESLEAHARALALEGVALAVEVASEREADHERPAISDLGIPAGAVRGAFDVRARVSGPPGLRARLFAGATPLAQVDVPDAPPREVLVAGVELAPGRHLLTLVVTPTAAPAATPADEDLPAAQARADSALARVEVEVSPRPRLLALTAQGERHDMVRAAGVQGFDVEVLDPSEALARLGAGTTAVDALLLDAQVAAQLDEAAAQLLRARVEQGLGLFVAPGGQPAAWAALAGSPLAALLPCEPLPEPPPEPASPPPPPPAAPRPPPPPPTKPPEPRPGPGLKAERRPEEALPISLLLVLDRSASMRGQAWAMAVEAAARAADVLSPFDRVGVITFAQDVRQELGMGPQAAPGTVRLHLPPQADGSGTNIVLALGAAAQVMARESSPIRHVILLTDGAHNPTGRRQEEALWTHVRRPLRQLGVTLTVVGLGEGQDSLTLNEIVQDVRGWSYRRADTPRQVPTVFVVDTLGLAESRSKEARARLPDPEARPEPSPEPAPPPEEPPEEPTEPAPPPSQPAPPPVPEGTKRSPLVLGAPHVATKGFVPEALPKVEAPARSGPRSGGVVLLSRAAGEIVLAARRAGIGRVLAFLSPPDDPGLRAWPELARLLGQSLRSLLAPEGVLTGAPRARVVASAQGDRLLLDGPEGAPDAPTRVIWASGGRHVDLGPLALVGADGLSLPRAPQGSLAHVGLVDAQGPAQPLTSYLAGLGLRPPDAATRRAEVERALAQAPPLRAVPPARERQPWTAWFLLAALLLLPLDVWLHVRGR